MKFEMKGKPTDVVNSKIGLTNNGLNGVIKDIEDERDYVFKAPVLSETLPSSASLLEYMGEIENQLSTGSCVANATCSALELMAKKEGNIVDLSRLFVYFNAREPYEELRGVDEGAYLRDGFKSCNNIGVPLESIWEFDESKVNTRPSQEAFDLAPDKKVITYERIYNGDRNGVKSAIIAGRPVVFGMYLYEDFFYLYGPMSSHDYRGSSSGSAYAGGHAMTIIGYDDNLNGGSFIVENSWSTGWGDRGLWALSYNVFNLDVMDIWVCSNFDINLMQPEPEPIPEPEELEIEDSFDKLKAWFHKTLRYVIDMFIEMPSMSQIWNEMIETLKKIWQKFKDRL